MNTDCHECGEPIEWEAGWDALFSVIQCECGAEYVVGYDESWNGVEEVGRFYLERKLDEA